MNNFKLINERWTVYKNEIILEEEFNRKLNILLKEIQILKEQGNKGSIFGKIGQFIKWTLDKIVSVVRSAPKTAINLINKFVSSAQKFLSNRDNQKKIISAIKAIAVLGLLTAALYSPEVKAAVVDPVSGKTLGPGGHEALTNVLRGSLGNIASALDNIAKSEFSAQALNLKQAVLDLISKINKPEMQDLTSLQKHILKVARVAVDICNDNDKQHGSSLVVKMSQYGKMFSDYIITGVKGVTTEYTGTLPGGIVKAPPESGITTAAGEAARALLNKQ